MTIDTEAKAMQQSKASLSTMVLDVLITHTHIRTVDMDLTSFRKEIKNEIMELNVECKTMKLLSYR